MNDIEKGREAKRVLESPIWQSANDDLDNWCLNQLQEHAGDADKCQQIAMLQVARAHYWNTLTTIMGNGQLAEIEEQD